MSKLSEKRSATIPASEGYLVVDTKKCQGCMTCMLVCTLVHEGKENLTLSGIQVIQNPFEKFPNDLTVEQCRQCAMPRCVEACPTGAIHADSQNGNVRRINAEECTGCMACVEACPFPTSRILWDSEKEQARKCDLCADTPYWHEKGGPGGRQACVELCPVNAIKFTRKMPIKDTDADKGYKVNLRGSGWRNLGYSDQ
ncbi:MAG: 4Fe-4S dicluster domain-containing protein [Deltaproteobacteria bacterium]|nr:MAG: 4Fe-4S dicluster domain-containing protein [Deltaproteobacteria bacterium]